MQVAGYTHNLGACTGDTCHLNGDFESPSGIRSRSVVALVQINPAVVGLCVCAGLLVPANAIKKLDSLRIGAGAQLRIKRKAVLVTGDSTGSRAVIDDGYTRCRR